MSDVLDMTFKERDRALQLLVKNLERQAKAYGK